MGDIADYYAEDYYTKVLDLRSKRPKPVVMASEELFGGEVWVDGFGKRLDPFADMEESHIRNTLAFIHRNRDMYMYRASVETQKRCNFNIDAYFDNYIKPSVLWNTLTTALEGIEHDRKLDEQAEQLRKQEAQERRRLEAERSRRVVKRPSQGQLERLNEIANKVGHEALEQFVYYKFGRFFSGLSRKEAQQLIEVTQKYLSPWRLVPEKFKDW